jgi:ATP-dependent exoDNAse (exonuclease V) beta subunit
MTSVPASSPPAKPPFEYRRGGAGSHKTTRLCREALEYLVTTAAHPSTLILTTYSRDAAGQLLDRLRLLTLRHSALPWPDKRMLIKALDAATIGTNHAIGRAAVEQHWLEQGSAPATLVVSKATREEFIKMAIARARRHGLSRRRRRLFNHLVRRLGRGETERRKLHSTAGTVVDDIRALMGFIPTSGLSRSAFVQACKTEINLLCQDLAAERTRRGVSGTWQQVVTECHRAAPLLQPHAATHRGQTETAFKAIEDFLREKSWYSLQPLETIKGHSKGKTPLTQPFVAPVSKAAKDYHLFPEFAADLKRYVNLVAQVALAASDEYQAMLAATGRLDFESMERAFNTLLDDPAIRRDFSSRYQFIGIDEAQDMTGVSAAAFGKVTDEIKQGMWIADPNQSIYRFRGADPYAVNAEAQRLVTSLSGAQNEDGVNHRSEPGVIRFINDLFHLLTTGGCPAQPLPVSHAQDAPVRKAANTGRIERWELKGTDPETRSAEVAEGVNRLRSGGVADRDICILVRTHSAKAAIARALRDRGIPVAMRASDGPGSREGLIIHNAIRLLLDGRDTLAEATLRFLLDGQPLLGSGNTAFERWLVDEVTRAPSVSMPPWLAAIRSAREQGLVPMLSPTAAVLMAVEATGLVGRIASWGDCIERQTQIDGMLALAGDFEKSEASSGRLATVAGFLTELSQKKPDASGDEGDREAPSRDLPGVRLMTFHASKGLGFKVTIVADFTLAKRQYRTHGVHNVRGRPVVFPWPTKDRQNQDFERLMERTASNQDRLKDALTDHVQLLYVTLTRSEGTLVLAHETSPTANEWLTKIFGPSDPAAGTPAGIDHFLPRNPAVKQVVYPVPSAPPPTPSTGVVLQAAAYAFVDDLMNITSATTDPAATTVDAIVTNQPRALHAVTAAPRFRSPSGNVTSACGWSHAAALIDLPLPAGVVRDLVTRAVRAAAGSVADSLGEAFHAFMAAIPSLPTFDARDPACVKTWSQVATRCIHGFLEPSTAAKVAAAGITPAVFVERGQAFVEWCRHELGVEPESWSVEVGIAGPAASGGMWRGRIDLLVKATTGVHAGRLVLIDHKMVLTGRDRCAAKSKEYFGEVSAYAEALAASPTLLAPAAIYLHFPLAGVVVPLESV